MTGPGIAAPALLGIYISPALLNDVNVDVTYESNAAMQVQHIQIQADISGTTGTTILSLSLILQVSVHVAEL